jgi:dihydrodipicolinate reductase
VGVIAAGNFAVMAAVLRRAASMAARHPDRWEIIDYASDDKPDVPSGTSRELAETLAQVREPAVTVPLADCTDCGGTRRTGRWHPDPLGAAAQLRRHHRSRVRRAGRAVDHAP